jgi:hypothetical protein
VSAVDQYQAHTEALAASSERQVLAIYGDMLDGRIPPNEATLLIAAVINRSNAQATALADTWLAVQIEQQIGQPTPTVGVLPTDGSDRLVKAAQTILADLDGKRRQRSITADQPAEIAESANADVGEAEPETDKAQNRLSRLARSEPLETAQQATHQAMQQQPLVEGWVRQMDADPCQLCIWWWRDGRVWPKDHPMPTHKGCNCSQRVVLTESVKSTGFTRRLERNQQ